MKFALGIDVGASTIKGAIVSSEGVLANRQQVKTDHDNVLSQIVAFAKQFNLLDVSGIGVGFPGVVEQGVVRSATNIAVSDLPLSQTLAEATQKKVVVINDADAALSAEIWLGAARGKKKVILLTLGSGIGGAITGQPNSEIGHTVIDPSSVLTCNRGHRGDIESLIGGLSTQKRLGRPSQDLLKEPSYLSFFVDWLAKSIQFLINQYQPEMVVLGGGMTEQSDLFISKLPQFSVPVQLAKLGNTAGIAGAAHQIVKGGLSDWLA